ncbi:MAG: hypothetical protein JXB25_01185 [Deltaproteobacteria bacterium]|nr:hypothetical protein [Deltaproteobacteria bacterium]
MAEQEQPKENKSSREKFWESTRKTFHVATSGAQRYTRLVQKKIDLAATHRKIPTVHGELGKVIDDLNFMGETRFLENREVVELLAKLNHLREMAASLEREIEEAKKEEAPPPPKSSH